MTGTFLAAVMDPNAVAFRAASVAGATIGGLAKIDNEWMTITQIVGPIVSVRGRGDQGGSAIAHDLNASVTFLVGSEMPMLGQGELVPAPTEDRGFLSVGSDQLIPWNSLRRDTILTISKGSAAALSLEAPSAAADGVFLTLNSATAFAHIVTAAGLIDDGVTGGAKTTMTFAAFVGASIQLMSSRGHWTVVSTKGVAVT